MTALIETISTPTEWGSKKNTTGTGHQETNKPGTTDLPGLAQGLGEVQDPHLVAGGAVGVDEQVPAVGRPPDLSVSGHVGVGGCVGGVHGVCVCVCGCLSEHCL